MTQTTKKSHLGHLSDDAWEDKLPTLKDLQSYDIWALRRHFLEKNFPNVSHFKTLEVGSGPGHDSLTFAQRGAEAHALDSSMHGLKHCKDIYKKEKLKITTHHASAEEIPLDDNTFDLTFNAGVLEHFTDEKLETVIDQMIRVTKPGGTILAFCPNKHYFYYQHHLRRIAKNHRYPFERAFTAKQMKQRFQARGLPHIHVSGVHIHPAPNYYLPQWLPKIHKIEPFFRFCFRWLENYNGLHQLKSLASQDFVVWGTKPEQLEKPLSFKQLTPGGMPVVDRQKSA